MFDFTGRTVLVTGAAAGIGYGITEVEWDPLPLYGPMYDDPPVDHD